jgi:hypothetical protein
MTPTQPTTHRVGRMIDCTRQVQMRHVPEGIIIPSGITFHVMEQVLPDGTLRSLARIDAILYAQRSNPVLEWRITAPGFEYQMPDVWLAVRAFSTEGDAIDALWRLRGMAEEGNLPNDLRDAI